MSDLTNFKLPSLELEAEIYYLTKQEGGRKAAFATGYRGQFYYDNNNWDASQQFIGKDWCQPGDTVKVLMQTARPQFHHGKFLVGMEFEIREGAKVVGKGRITKVLRLDFNYSDSDTLEKQQ